VTPPCTAAPDADARARVQAVRQRYAHRGGRATVRGLAYTLYLVVLFALFYLVPIVHAASTAPALVPVGSLTGATPVACLLAVTACWGCLLIGRFWGPLVTEPFLLHVLGSTDLPPTSYLGTIARRRLTRLGTGALLSTCTAAFLTTDLFDDLDTAVPALAVAAGVSGVCAVSWLWGQVRPVRDHLLLAVAAATVALVVAAPSRSAPDGGGGPWLLAGASAVAAAALGRVAFRSIRTVDLTRLARESARASQARTYAWTGTLHHALDLYRPEPHGLTTALFRADGRLRGHLVRGALRALRTPGRTIAAVLLLVIGGAVLTRGAAGPQGGPSWLTWVAGAICAYLGSGWVSETWRGLRDELTLAPLYGERWGTAPARALAWPVTAVVVGTCLGGGLAVATGWSPHGDRPLHTALLVAGSVLLVLGARFLREMKGQLPLELLLPVVTPLGDLSGLLVVAWQFDGAVAVVLGVGAMDVAASAPGAAALALATTACCVWLGLRRTGRTHRGLLSRLRRA
jgi:hypothetical protein